MKTAYQIYIEDHGTSEFTAQHVAEVINNLYKLGLAQAFFAGLGWPEGFKQCQRPDYLQSIGANIILRDDRVALWCACEFLAPQYQQK